MGRADHGASRAGEHNQLNVVHQELDEVDDNVNGADEEEFGLEVKILLTLAQIQSIDRESDDGDLD